MHDVRVNREVAAVLYEAAAKFIRVVQHGPRLAVSIHTVYFIVGLLILRWHIRCTLYKDIVSITGIFDAPRRVATFRTHF